MKNHRVAELEDFASAIRENAYALAGGSLTHFEVSADVRQCPAYESASQPYLFTFQFLDRRNGTPHVLSYQGRNEVDASDFHSSELAREHLAVFGAQLAHQHPPVSFEVCADTRRAHMNVFIPRDARVPVDKTRTKQLFAEMRAALQ